MGLAVKFMCQHVHEFHRDIIRNELSVGKVEVVDALDCDLVFDIIIEAKLGIAWDGSKDLTLSVPVL